VTEQEWLTSDNPSPMLNFIQSRASTRKLRLFACACCRSVWDSLYDLERRAVVISERHADGMASPSELTAITEEARLRWAELYGEDSNTVLWLVADEIDVRDCLDVLGMLLPSAGVEDELTVYTTLLRDVFGNPFVQIATAPSWLSWNNNTVVKLAQDIYGERAFDRMPILADALEDTGCDNADMLGHLRGPGPHARGCWVVDLLLGRS
jgi:hypothetical protein